MTVLGVHIFPTHSVDTQFPSVLILSGHFRPSRSSIAVDLPSPVWISEISEHVKQLYMLHVQLYTIFLKRST